MPARRLQRCPMCLLMKPVVHSHLIPEALYLHVTDGTSPIRVGDGVVMPTDRQIKSYLLCLDCEDILSKGGETWVCPKLAWVDQRFPLYDLLKVADGYIETDKEALLWAANNPAIDVEKIRHFAMGIFWKASVHSWKAGNGAPMIDLGGYDEEVRLWLRGESPFPRNVTLNLSVSRPERTQLTIGHPVEVPMPKAGRTWRRYHLHLVGAMFSINVGETIGLEEKMICFYREPRHPVLVSDHVTGILEQKYAEHFAESRKTKAYLKSKRRRGK
jgi:hypothetical protein